MLAFNADHYHQLHEALSLDETLRGAYELCVQHKNDRLWGFTANILIGCILYSVAKPPHRPYINLRDWAVARMSLQDIKRSFKAEQYKHEGRDGFQRVQGFFERLSEAFSVALTIPVCDHNYGLPLFKEIEGRYQVVDDSDPDLAYILRQLSEGGPTDAFTSCPSWAEQLFVSTQIYEAFNLLGNPAEAKDEGEVFKSALTLNLRHRYSGIVGSEFGNVQGGVRPLTRENKQPINDRLETSYLNIIGALLEVIAGDVPGWEKHPSMVSKAKLIEKLVAHYRDIPGMSQRNLQDKFPKAKRSLK
jgi:hypothetical protein